MAGQDNLTPFTKDDDRASEAGKLGGAGKKGSRHLATLIRDIGMNIDWDKTNLKDKKDLEAKYGKNGWQALIYVAMTKAISGDVKAMNWLSEYGFGKKIDLTSDDEPIAGINVNFVGVDTDNEQGN